VWQFIPCDVLSLVLQATGGGIASVASHKGSPVDTGDDIMIAGLAFQVFTTLIFILCALDFGLHTLHRRRHLGPQVAFEQDALARQIRESTKFKLFLVALGVSTVCIFWRCVFRVAELAHGWNGDLTKRQDLFIGFEGVMIAVAVLLLNVFHPSICMGLLMEGQHKHRHGHGSRKPETPYETDASY
jgi:hypothetical protein